MSSVWYVMHGIPENVVHTELLLATFDCMAAVTSTVQHNEISRMLACCFGVLLMLPCEVHMCIVSHSVTPKWFSQ